MPFSKSTNTLPDTGTHALVRLCGTFLDLCLQDLLIGAGSNINDVSDTINHRRGHSPYAGHCLWRMLFLKAESTHSSTLDGRSEPFPTMMCIPFESNEGYTSRASSRFCDMIDRCSAHESNSRFANLDIGIVGTWIAIKIEESSQCHRSRNDLFIKLRCLEQHGPHGSWQFSRNSCMHIPS